MIYIRIMVDNTPTIINAAEQDILRALEIIGGKAESYAKALTPRKTGALLNSFTHAVNDNSVTIGSNVHYAPYIELGTGKLYNPPPEWIAFQAKRGRGLNKWFYKDEQGNWHVGYPRVGVHMLQKALADHIDEYKHIIRTELSR